MRGTLRVALVALLLSVGASAPPQAQAPEKFSSLIERLSEPGAYFDTDNLISNERSYLHVLPALDTAGTRGGVYLGVGADQNFSYIARIRPIVAFIVDIRRDNLLLHLLFKALFGLAETRIEYLSALTWRSPPEHPDSWRGADFDELVAYIDGARVIPGATGAHRARVDTAIKRMGVSLALSELETVARFHRTFIAAGLSLKFQSYGRPPRSYYPTYRELLLETDQAGCRCNYLASEDDFQFVRSLQKRDLVVPIVGDLSGHHALSAIGLWMSERGERLSAFYTSNVEYYLFMNGRLSRFVDNLLCLPHNDRSVVIRAIFSRIQRWDRAETVPEYVSTSLAERVSDVIEHASGR